MTQLLRCRIIWTLLTLLGFCMPCDAESVLQVDLRDRTAMPIDYYVVICARESEPWGAGHSFVVWIQEDQRTGKVRSQGFGFYPAVERVVLRLFTGDGAVLDESTKLASMKPDLLTHRLIFQVDRETFEASLAVKDQWSEDGINYSLFSRNCTHFAHEVMSAIRGDIPEPVSYERPSAYISRLMTIDFRGNCVERIPAIFANQR